MIGLKFILVLCAVFYIINGSTVEQSNEALKQFIRARLQKFKAEVEQAHGLSQTEDLNLKNETESPISSSYSRSKRTIIGPFNIQPGRQRRNITGLDFDGTDIATKTFELTRPRFNEKLLFDLNIITIESEYHAFALEKSDDSTDVEMVVYSLQNLDNIQESVRISTPGATSVEVTQIGSEIYVIPIQPTQQTGEHGSHLYLFDPISHGLRKVQTIQTPNARISHFWVGSGQEANNVFLAIAPDHTVSSSGKIQYKVQVPVYMWQGGYFDRVYSLTAFNPQAIEYTSISSHEYLAVANYQDTSKSTTIFSEIFRFSYKESRFTPFQRVLTHGAKDIKFFSFENGQRGDHFLAIANQCQYDEFGTVNYNVKSQILKLASERFIPFQSIATNGAFQVLPVKIGRQFMLVVGETSQFRIIQYNGFRFVETLRKSFSESNDPPNFIRLRSLVFDNRPFFAVASSDKTKVASGIFGFEFVQKNVGVSLRNDYYKWCTAAVAKMEAADVPTMEKEFRRAPKTTDKEILLHGDITFHHVTSDLLEARSLTLGDRSFDVELSRQLVATEVDLKATEDKILEAEVKLGQVLLKNAKQDVSTEVHFTNVEHIGSRIQSVDVTTEKLNKVDVKQMLSQLIFLDKDYSFRSVTAEHITSGDADFFSRLNGHAYSEYARRTSQSTQKFQQENKFSAEVRIQKGITVKGLFAGVDFDDITFLTSTGNQTFSSPIHIQNSHVANLYAHNVNDVDLQFYMKEAVNKGDEAVITGAKEFQSVHFERLQANKISDVDINKLYTESIYLDTARNTQKFIGATANFDELSTTNVKVSTSVMNNKYNIDDLVRINGGTYNLDSLVLVQDAVIRDLQVTRSLNTIRVNDDGELNVILKNSDKTQVISSKVYSHINLEKDATAEGDINGINFAEWSAEKRIELKSNTLEFRNLQINGDLTCIPGINYGAGRMGLFKLEGRDVSNVLARALLLNATSLPEHFTGEVHFVDSVDVAENTQVISINDFAVSDWVRRNSKEKITITGEKTFAGTLELRSSSSTNELYSSNDANAENILPQMQDFMLDGVEQTIRRTTKFTERVSIDKLDCPNANLNGILFKDLLLVHGNQHVSGKTVFEKAVGVQNEFQVKGDLEVDKILLHGKYHSLNELIGDALLVSSTKPQIVTGKYEFSDDFTTNSLTTVDDFGGSNIASLLSGIVRKDVQGPHALQGSLTFANMADIERIEFTGSVNGQQHTEWGEGFLLTTGHQIITTPVKFMNGLQASAVEVEDEKISNINFMKLAEDALRIDDHGSLGFVEFTGLVEPVNGVSLGPDTKVNGYNIFTDILLNGAEHDAQVVTETKTFTKPVKIRGNLNVNGVHGFDYDQAVEFVTGATNSREENLHILGGLTLKHEPNFVSKVNGFEWDSLMNDIWWAHKPTTIRSQIKFENMIFQDEVLLTGTLNDFDLEELERTYLSKTKDQVIEATEIVFEVGLEVKALSVPKIEIASGSFNGVKLKEFSKTVFLNGPAQTVPLKLEFEELDLGEIKLGEGVRVGRLDLSEETITLNGENIVTGRKTVENLISHNLQLGNYTKLNGINVHEWTQKAVTSDGDFSIEGDVRIQEATFTVDVTAESTVDGKEFNKDNIFTLSDDQIIKGKITFINQVQVSSEGIETEFFNGQNLTEVVDSFVMADDQDSGPIIVTGEKTFTRILDTESVQAEALVLNQNLTEVFDVLKPEAHMDMESLMDLNLEKDYDELIEKTKELITLSEKQAVFLDFYEFTHKVPVENVVNFKPLILHDAKSVGLGIVTKSTGGLFASSASAHSFSFMMHNTTTNSYFNWALNSVKVEGNVKDFIEVQHGQDYFVVMSTSSTTKSVTLDVESEEVDTMQGADGLSKTVILQLKQQANGSKNWVVRQTLAGHRFGSISSFKITNTVHGSVNCFMVVDYGLSDSDEDAKGFIYTFNDGTSKNSVSLLQQIRIERPSEITSIDLKSTTLLLTGSRGSGDIKGHGEVIYAWKYDMKKSLFTEVDCLPTVNLVSMHTIAGPNNNIFLALASGQINEHSGSVYIYKFTESTQKFVKVLYIPVDQPKQVQFQLIYSEAFLYILNSGPVHNVQVYSFKGKMGWVNEHRFTAKNAQILRSSGFKLGNDLTSEVLIAGQNDVSVFTGVFHGNKKNYMRISANEEKLTQRRGKRFSKSKSQTIPGLNTTSPGLRLISALFGTLINS